jgi:hypothetical protein
MGRDFGPLILIGDWLLPDASNCSVYACFAVPTQENVIRGQMSRRIYFRVVNAIAGRHPIFTQVT